VHKRPALSQKFTLARGRAETKYCSNGCKPQTETPLGGV
jgi:hypothetical protein